jgi:hypothetical protein
VLACGIVLAAAFAAAQSGDEPGTAVLQEGPVQRRGIEYFAPDLTPHWYGTYAPAGSQDGLIEIYYATQPIQEAVNWPLSSCNSLRLRFDGEAYYYLDEDEWALLFLPQADTIDLCGFATRFTRQFEFFQNLERNIWETPSFPAVIDFR